MQLCTSEQDAEEHVPEDYVVEDHVVTSIMLKAIHGPVEMDDNVGNVYESLFGFCHLTIAPNM